MSNADDLHFNGVHMHRWYYWRFAHLVEKCLPQPSTFTEWIGEDLAAQAYVEKMIQVEAVTTYLSFLEVLPVYLQHVHRAEGLQEHLLKYQVSNSEAYYRALTPDNWQLTYRSLGYPIFDHKWGSTFAESAKAVHGHLMQCGKLYLRLKGLLNAFKHGMRVMPVFMSQQDEEPTEILPYNAIAFFHDRKNDDQMQIVYWSEEQISAIARSFRLLQTIVEDLFRVFGYIRTSRGTAEAVDFMIELRVYNAEDIPDLPEFIERL